MQQACLSSSLLCRAAHSALHGSAVCTEPLMRSLVRGSRHQQTYVCSSSTVLLHCGLFWLEVAMLCWAVACECWSCLLLVDTQRVRWSSANVLVPCLVGRPLSWRCFKARTVQHLWRMGCPMSCLGGCRSSGACARRRPLLPHAMACRSTNTCPAAWTQHMTIWVAVTQKRNVKQRVLVHTG